ncbi:MAG: cytochrome c3 family protein [Burkholderiales bacterium]
MASTRLVRNAAVLVAVCAALSSEGWAARVSDVRGSTHNLSASGAGSVRSASETQVCVFCHTPHAATPAATPLWNRLLSSATYTVYTSSSLDASAIQGSLDQPGGSSKLCLSCHDGTLAIGNVNVLSGQGSADQQGTIPVPLSGTGSGGVIPPGAGATSGFTRNLGISLSNDHPISLSFTNTLAARDGELRDVDANQKWPPGSGTVLGVRSSGYRPLLPLEPTGAGNTGQVQCATCHDPHLIETDLTLGSQKFLRQNRFQEAPPANAYDQANDLICLSCHDKNRGSGTWAYSVHANPLVATQAYKAAPAADREFPANLPVWKAACLNCHDTHTVPGARRLLREATDGITSPKTGGEAALEENCYQCHTDAAASVVTPSTGVPNIRNDFLLPRRMPIASSEQPAGSEVHDIGGNFSDGGFVDCSGPTNQCGKDFVESRARLGAGNLSNRHAECSDCHNPHRVVKFRSFAGNPPGNLTGAPDAAATHRHDDAAGFVHSNVASGALRGAWGVEPIYGSASFQNPPISYLVRRGDPGASADTSVAAAYVTREYQICLKCHSDYGYSDNNLYPTGNRPGLGSPGTPSGANNLTQYSNQAKEFQAPLTHKGELSTNDSGAAAAFALNNHRSWHPVLDDTGRTPAVRGGLSANNWNFPWRNAVGAQTMYCADCHGSNVSSATSVIPDGGENGNPWGPHGSSNDFLLKGAWNANTGTGQQATGLCFKCHSYSIYATASGTRTGFWMTDRGEDGHSMHADRIGRLRCTWCHVAVPHGWKNKAFLVNLNDAGPEAGLPAGTQVRNNTTAPFNQQPYYLNAILKVRNFKASGQWTAADCGSAGAPGNGQSGRDWMRDSNENCQNPP